MSVSGNKKLSSQSSFISVHHVSTDEEEEVRRENEAENLRVSLHEIKNLEMILK